jgi:Type IV secretion system pilin
VRLCAIIYPNEPNNSLEKETAVNRFKQIVTALAATIVAATVLAAPAFAVPDDLTAGIKGSQPTGATDCLFAGQAGCTGTPIFQSVANVLIFIVGAVAVIMLIIGGLRYVLSSGNSSSVEGAKNTILYAIIGIVVAALAFAAVTFVSSKLG